MLISFELFFYIVTDSSRSKSFLTNIIRLRLKSTSKIRIRINLLIRHILPRINITSIKYQIRMALSLFSASINYKLRAQAFTQTLNNSLHGFVEYSWFRVSCVSICWQASHHIVGQLTSLLRMHFQAFFFVHYAHLSLCTKEEPYKRMPMNDEKEPKRLPKI